MAATNRAENLSQLRIAADYEADRFTLSEDWETGREPVFGWTIDGEYTRARDDAIAVSVIEKTNDGYYLASISIADVASFLTQEDTPAIEAYARELGETRHMARGKRRMIPPRISEHMLSIVKNREKIATPVLTVSIIVGADGTLHDMDFTRDSMMPRALTYDQVARLRNGGRTDEYAETMRAYEKVARILFKRRTNKGVGVNDEELNTDMQHPGEMIVSEFMILANTAVGKYMRQNNIPGLYRFFDGTAATYVTNPVDFESLGTGEPYAHFTSPLRRFADFVNHANIVAFMEGREFPYQGEELEKIAAHLNEVQANMRYQRMLRQRVVGAEAIYNTRQTGLAKAA